MKRYCIDNHLLIWGIREHADPGQEEMIPRTKHFFEQCKKDKIQIVVPSVVLAELLTAIDTKHHLMVNNLINSAFFVLPFDSISSVAFARLWRERQESGAIEKLKSEAGAKRQELKADCMIVASSLAHKVDAIYSHDETLRKFSNGTVPVLEIPKMPAQQPLELIVGGAGEG